MCLFLRLGRLIAKENKNQHLKSESQTCTQACWWQICLSLRAGWILVSQTWLTGRTASWGLPGCNSPRYDLGIHLAVHGWNVRPASSGQPASQPASLSCPMDACMWFLCTWRQKRSYLPRKTRLARCLQWVPVVSHWRGHRCCHCTPTPPQGGPLGVKLY